MFKKYKTSNPFFKLKLSIWINKIKFLFPFSNNLRINMLCKSIHAWIFWEQNDSKYAMKLETVFLKQKEINYRKLDIFHPYSSLKS